MASRKPISKRRRFDIFKRDGFQCQYCGARKNDAFRYFCGICWNIIKEAK